MVKHENTYVLMVLVFFCLSFSGKSLGTWKDDRSQQHPFFFSKSLGEGRHWDVLGTSTGYPRIPWSSPIKYRVFLKHFSLEPILRAMVQSDQDMRAALDTTMEAVDGWDWGWLLRKKKLPTSTNYQRLTWRFPEIYGYPQFMDGLEWTIRP